MAAAVVGGEWTDGAVRFETGSDAVNRLVSTKPSGAYGSKVAAAYERLQHSGRPEQVKKEWESLCGQVELASSNRCDRAVTDDAFLGACWWLLESRMLIEIEQAVIGQIGRMTFFYPKGVKMGLDAKAYLRERYVADGMLAKPLSGQALPSAFALYLGIVDGKGAESAADGLKAALEAGPIPRIGAFEWRIVLDALSWYGKADAAYGLLLKRPDGIDNGAALSFLWRTAAGIASDPTNPGFRNVIMAPRPDRRLGFVKAEYKSAAGLIKSAWRYEGKKWIWDFTVPRKSTASVTLPGESFARHYDAGDHHVELEVD